MSVFCKHFINGFSLTMADALRLAFGLLVLVTAATCMPMPAGQRVPMQAYYPAPRYMQPRYTPYGMWWPYWGNSRSQQQQQQLTRNSRYNQAYQNLMATLKRTRSATEMIGVGTLSSARFAAPEPLQAVPAAIPRSGVAETTSDRQAVVERIPPNTEVLAPKQEPAGSSKGRYKIGSVHTVATPEVPVVVGTADGKKCKIASQFPHPTSAHHYLFCNHGKYIVRQCAPGTVYCHGSGLCCTEEEKTEDVKIETASETQSDNTKPEKATPIRLEENLKGDVSEQQEETEMTAEGVTEKRTTSQGVGAGTGVQVTAGRGIHVSKSVTIDDNGRRKLNIHIVLQK